jgi:hypothetical protein
MPEGYWISPHNPNAEQGGGDIITPTHQTVDARGPWVVFPNVDSAEAQGQVPLPHTILPASVIETIYAELKSSGIVADETGGEGDIRDKIAAQPATTVEWEDLPVHDQNVLQAQFPKGGPTRTTYGIVDVPAEGGAVPVALSTVPGEDPEDEAALAALVQETPDEKGGYSPVEDPDAEDAPAI